MRLLNGWAAGILLALYLVAPAHSASRCSERAQSIWLTSCGWALDAIRRAESPHPENPRENTDALFTPQTNLSDEFVDACYELLAQPGRVPTSDHLRSFLRSSLADPCTRNDHLQWLRSCESDAHALVGLTRADLLRTFHEEGGLSTFSERTYLHRRCHLLKVEIQFSLTHPDTESPDDVIEDVSSPYIGEELFG